MSFGITTRYRIGLKTFHFLSQLPADLVRHPQGGSLTSGGLRSVAKADTDHTGATDQVIFRSGIRSRNEEDVVAANLRDGSRRARELERDVALLVELNVLSRAVEGRGHSGLRLNRANDLLQNHETLRVRQVVHRLRDRRRREHVGHSSRSTVALLVQYNVDGIGSALGRSRSARGERNIQASLDRANHTLPANTLALRGSLRNEDQLTSRWDLTRVVDIERLGRVEEFHFGSTSGEAAIVPTNTVHTGLEVLGHGRCTVSRYGAIDLLHVALLLAGLRPAALRRLFHHFQWLLFWSTAPSTHFVPGQSGAGGRGQGRGVLNLKNPPPLCPGAPNE